MKQIRVATAIQATLLKNELMGQISDGAWENSGPRDHWKDVTSADVVVDPVSQGFDGFYPRRSYQFSRVIEYVGDRMLTQARARILFPDLTDDTLKYIDYGDWVWKETGAHYDEVRSALATVGIKDSESRKAVLEQINAVNYTEKELRKDLLVLQRLFAANKR